MRGIITLGLLLFGMYAVSGKATELVLNNALVSLRSLTFEAGATVLDIVQGIKPLILSVDVTNTQEIGTTVNSFVGTAFINGFAVADVQQDFNIKMKPGESIIIDIPVLLDSAAVLNAAADSLATKLIPPINIVGTITANGFTYPVNETFELSF